MQLGSELRGVLCARIMKCCSKIEKLLLLNEVLNRPTNSFNIQSHPMMPTHKAWN